jgi:hypothetical protein
MKSSGMRCSMNFGNKSYSGSAPGAPVLPSRVPGIGLKENVMRVSMLALATSIVCVAALAPAQTVIDVEDQKAPLPSVPDRSIPQPPGEIPDLTQENPPATPPGRFTFSRVNNGFVRLDNDSGQVAFCSSQGRGWACQAASENHAAVESQLADLQDDVTTLKKLQTEIAALRDGVASVQQLQAEIIRLRDEVLSLKKEIVALKEPPPPRPPTDLSSPGEKDTDVTIKLPTREDMARASAFIHETWRRLVDMINTVQKDMMRKG